MPTRIAHKIPLTAYDHIAGRLQEAAGKDNVISRKEAKALVTALKEEGRGTEAFLAHNIFTIVDKRDAAKGSKVTGYDLNLTRSFVQEKMLERLDVNANGYSRAEIAMMSTTGKGLIELGRTLESSRSKGRVSHATVEKGLQHVAGLITDAAGKDGVISRKDIDRLVSHLYSEGRGTEGLAVAKFASFIDHRDSKAGARVTDADVKKAVEFAREHMLENRDTNRNGYSREDIAKMSPSAKAFVLIGQMLTSGIID